MSGCQNRPDGAGSGLHHRELLLAELGVEDRELGLGVVEEPARGVDGIEE